MRGFIVDSRCIIRDESWPFRLGKINTGQVSVPLPTFPATTAPGFCFTLAELLIFRAAVLFYTEKIEVKGRIAHW